MANANGLDQFVMADGVQPLNWSDLLGQHERWLRTVIFARLGGHEGVDEVLQEVSLAAVRQGPCRSQNPSLSGPPIAAVTGRRGVSLPCFPARQHIASQKGYDGHPIR